jgi:hypothetical protein
MQLSAKVLQLIFLWGKLRFDEGSKIVSVYLTFSIHPIFDSKKQENKKLILAIVVCRNFFRKELLHWSGNRKDLKCVVRGPWSVVCGLWSVVCVN